MFPTPTIDSTLAVFLEGCGFGALGFTYIAARRPALAMLKLLSAGGLGVWALVDWWVIMLAALDMESTGTYVAAWAPSSDRALSYYAAAIFVAMDMLVALVGVWFGYRSWRRRVRSSSVDGSSVDGVVVAVISTTTSRE
jgi:membrane protein YdbS with pleckstrin-like domain